MGRSVPSHLHRAKIPCTHGNVTHGDFRGVSGTVRTQPTVLNVLRVPRWGRVARQFLDEIFSLIQRNSQDEVLGFFSIENFVREFWSESLLSFVYYESIKREIRVKPIYECRCDGRLQTKRFTRLSYTGLVVELEHLKIQKVCECEG